MTPLGQLAGGAWFVFRTQAVTGSVILCGAYVFARLVFEQTDNLSGTWYR